MPAECLECLIGATRVEVPLADVERLLEYRAAPPPPLAQPWLGGIGVADKEDLFLSVSLSGQSASEPRAVRGLLIRSADRRLRWALEVDRVIGLRSIEEDPALYPVDGWPCPPDWLLHGSGDAGEVRWLDVQAAARALATAETADLRE